MLKMSAAFATAILSATGTMDAFEESKHPRKGGKFTSKGNGDGAKAPKAGAAKAPAAKKTPTAAKKAPAVPGSRPRTAAARADAHENLTKAAVASAQAKSGKGGSKVHVVTTTQKTKTGDRTSVKGVYASKADADHVKSEHEARHGAGSASLSSHDHDGSAHVSVSTSKSTGADGVQRRNVHGVSADHGSLHGAAKGAKTERFAVKGRGFNLQTDGNQRVANPASTNPVKPYITKAAAASKAAKPAAAKTSPVRAKRLI